MTHMDQFDWAAKWAHYLPNKSAIKEAESGKSISYGELNRRATALAAVFSTQFKLDKGNRIVVLTENCIENILLFSMAQKTGICLIPLNYRLSPKEINKLIEDANPGLIIYEEKLSGLLSEYQKNANQQPLIELKALESWIEKGLNIPQTDVPDGEFSEDDPLLVLYTSGSTGIPKGALYTRKMMFWNSINTSLTITLGSETRTVMCMPPFHTGGWNVLTTPLLLFGGYSCLVKKFDADHIIQLLETEKPQVFMAVPTMLKMIADSERFKDADFSSLSYLIVGGEPLPIPLIEEWHKKGVKIRQGYGMTEVGPNLTSLHHDFAISKKGSIGKTNFFLDYKIVNESVKVVNPGETGELIFKGPVVTPGYWNKPEATASAIKNGWFHTGDLAKVDADGFLYIVDRIKNMYISGGENVYPAQIERVLISHPDISAAAVVPFKDPKWGESGCAFIIPEKGKKPDEAAILKYCKENLAKYKIPKKVRFMDDFPKTDSGKIDRKSLAERV